ncbi:MAG TPA: hypothetical protein VF268_15450 [Gammaproteobacteria bacterium]
MKINNLPARNIHRFAGALLAALFLISACSGPTKIESDLGIKGAPDWVNEGTQAVSNKKGRLIQGVGSAPDLGDMSLQQSTADNRARAEIAKVLSSYLEVTLNDYLASSSQPQENGAGGYAADASVQQQINNFSKVVLNGSRIVGHWKDKRTGMIYSFAELDLKKVQEMAAAAGTMNEGLKHYIVDQGNAVFDNFVMEK